MTSWIQIGMTLRISFWGDLKPPAPTSWDANRARRGRSQFPLLRLSGKRRNRATFMANMLDIEPPAQTGGQGPPCQPRAPRTGCQGDGADRDNPQEGSGIPGAKMPSPLLHPTSSRSLARTCSSISTSTGATSYVYLEGPSGSRRVPLPLKPQNPKNLPPAPQQPKTLPLSTPSSISTSTGGWTGGVRAGFWRVLSPLGSSTPPKPSHQTSAPQNPRPSTSHSISTRGSLQVELGGRGGPLQVFRGSPHPPAPIWGCRGLTGLC